MANCSFLFHGELNLFLVPGRRGQGFSCVCARAATAKHMVEALGVPHTEVGGLVINGDPSELGRLLAEGDALEIHPWPAAAAAPGVRPRFVADAHLGGLARLLRMAGFDTVYRNDLADEEVAGMAQEGRVVLSRDRELLKRKEVGCGCYPFELVPEAQARRVFRRFGLAPLARPFSLCLGCNVPLGGLARPEAAGRVPPAAFALNERFSTCPSCGKVFWPGSHWRRMKAMLDALTTEGVPGEP